MSSIFDMNTPERVCPICMHLHAKTIPCKYDTLVQTIHTMRSHITTIMKANRDAVDTAKAFQKLIIDLTPETERLVWIEMEYKKLVAGLKGAKVLTSLDGALAGVSIDDINLMLPPDMDDKAEFNSWLKSRNEAATTPMALDPAPEIPKDEEDGSKKLLT